MDIKKCFEQISAKANDPETEFNFRTTCSWYEGQCYASGKPFSQDYQEYINFYHHITSLYLTIKENKRTKLIIYDTESGKKEIKELNTWKPLGPETSITQLPTGELFCYGTPFSGMALIIDRTYEVWALPSGIPSYFSSSLYFNGYVYCFGGRTNVNALSQSRKFDLINNRWIKLASMPQADVSCHSVAFNGNILISGFFYKNLLLYSPNIDSFSTIPYDFSLSKGKILIYVEKLYLIECFSNGLIYESEDEYNWKIIGESIINGWSCQTYYLYNKGGIYIAVNLNQKYYRFDLKQKIMTQIL